MITAQEAREITNGCLEKGKIDAEQIIPKIEELIKVKATEGKSFAEAFICIPNTGNEIKISGIEEQKKDLFSRQNTKRASEALINGVMKSLQSSGFSTEKYECGGSFCDDEYEPYATGKIGHIILIRW